VYECSAEGSYTQDIHTLIHMRQKKKSRWKSLQKLQKRVSPVRNLRAKSFIGYI
jgi:hypothetical protein